MIVLPRPTGGLRVIHQPDHAAMSADLAAAWRRPASLSDGAWQLFLEAVRHHDDGWLEEEEAPCLDANRRPCDFKNLPAARHVLVWRRSVELATRRHPLIGLLVAGHASWLYLNTSEESDRGPLERQFLIDMEADTAALRLEIAGDERTGQLAADARRFEETRRLLTFFDGLSLMLLAAVPHVRATAPLAFADESSSLELDWGGEGARVSPWPFRSAELTVDVPARELDTDSFHDGAAVARALVQTPPRQIRARCSAGL